MRRKRKKIGSKRIAELFIAHRDTPDTPPDHECLPIQGLSLKTPLLELELAGKKEASLSDYFEPNETLIDIIFKYRREGFILCVN